MRAPRTAPGWGGTSSAVASPPRAASSDTEITTTCHGSSPPNESAVLPASPARARKPWGSAVPSTSAPISTPITAPRRSRYQLAAIFIPTG
jgi:hypothetical protein